MELLRPMDTGELLDAALGIYRRHLGLLVRIGVAVYAVPTVVSTYASAALSTDAPLWVYLLAVSGYLLQLLAGAVVAAATLQVIADAYLGRRPALSVAFQTARARFIPVIAANVARFAVVLLPPFSVAVLAAAVPWTGLGFGVLLAVVLALGLAALVLTVLLLCGFSVTTEVAVLEELPRPSAAVKRSWALTRGFRGRALVLGFIAFLIVALPVMGAGMLAGLFPRLEVLLDALAALVSIVIAPVVACVFTLYYYDLRVRKEGFDLELLSRQIAGALPTRA